MANITLCPHIEILQAPSSALEGMAVEDTMEMVRDVRNFIGRLKDAWYATKTCPPEEFKIFQQAEDVGLRLFQAISIPDHYWRDSEDGLERTLVRLETTPDIRDTFNRGFQLTLQGKTDFLQKAMAIMAEEQSRDAPVTIRSGRVHMPYPMGSEGNVSAFYQDSPECYKIEINPLDKNGFIRPVGDLVKCAMHEQTHIKQITFAHAYCLGQLPEAFHTAARYFIAQTDSYIPSWRSDRLWEAQRCEREALMATNSRNLRI